MKRIALLPLALSLTTLLTGCGQILNQEYRSVTRHVIQTADQEDTSALRVENYSDLVNCVQYFVSIGQPEGVIHLYRYPGDINHDLEAACHEVMTQDPLGAWAVEDIRWHATRIVSYYECQLYFQYRHSKETITTVPVLIGTSNIRSAISKALTSFSDTVRFRTHSYYASDELILSLVQEAYYSNPGYALGYPTVTIRRYPETSSSQQLAELCFQYSGSQQQLQTEAQNVAAAANMLVGLSPSQGEVGCWLLHSQLSNQLDFDPAGSSSVSAALTGSAPCSSESVALAFQLLCDTAQLPCITVRGTRDELPHWWNIVTIDGTPRHVDVTAALPEDAFLRCDEQMAGYTWDTSFYPVCPHIQDDHQAPAQSE